MQLTIRVDTSPFDELERRSRRVDEAFERAAQEAGELLQNSVVPRVPVRTGRLKAGMQAGLTVTKTDDGASATLASGVPYDSYVNNHRYYYEDGLAAVYDDIDDTVMRVIREELFQ